jgi:prephenate dehydrogenase
MNVRSIMVVGVGLIGGSLLMRVRERAPEIVRLGIDLPEVVDTAVDAGLVAEGGTLAELEGLVERHRPELVALCLPIPRIVDLLQGWGTHPLPGTPLVFDTGSVKGPIMRAAAGCPRFVGGHPMAGRERGGLAAAEASLLAEGPFVICPSEDHQAAHELSTVLQQWGLRAHEIPDAARHDRAVALVSHIPHILAPVLLDQLAAHPDATLAREIAAGSWRDATRVGASDRAAWNLILAHNRESILEAVTGLIRELQTVQKRLDGHQDAFEPD